MGKRAQLSADVPIQRPSQDKLGREPFAKSFAKTLLIQNTKNSQVFAICGPWGCGKSSLLNLVVRELEKTRRKHKPTILRFNPWWFSDSDQLLRAFLHALGEAIDRPDTKAVLLSASTLLKRLSSVLAPLTLVPGASTYATAAKNALGPVDEMVSQLAQTVENDVEGIRQQIDDLLEKQRSRVFIVMDDIDRLPAEEMAQVFKILRAVAPFRNTTYLVAYDHHIVDDVLTRRLHLDGAAYLEKVVQLRIDVPMPAKHALETMFVDGLSDLQIDIDGAALVDFGNVFHKGVAPFLGTPRDVARLLNVIRFTYAPLLGEVYIPDLIGICCLQAFVPSLYEVVRSTPSHFAGHCGRRNLDYENLKAFHEAAIGAVCEAERAAAEALLCELFAKSEWALGGASHGSDFEDRWQHQLRVRSELHFDKYFQLSLPSGAMSESEWNRVIGMLSEPPEFDAMVMAMFVEAGRNGEHTKGKEFIDRARVFARSAASNEEASRLFECCLRTGDELANTEDREAFMLPVTNTTRVVWLCRACLQRVGVEAASQWLNDAVLRPYGLLISSELVLPLGYQHGMFREYERPFEREPDVDEESVTAFVEDLRKRLRDAAEGGELEKHAKYMQVVGNWAQIDDSEVIAQFVKSVGETDKGFVDILRQMKSEGRVWALGDAVARRSSRVPCDYLAEYFDPTDMRGRAKTLLEGSPEWLTQDDLESLRIVVSSITPEGAITGQPGQ
jgi:hypothetical protein